MPSADNWLKKYLEYTAFSEAPEQFHFWTGVYTIAAALRRRVWIDDLYFQWTPNFYIILVAPPGIATKGSAIRMGTDLLSSVKDIQYGPSSLTWQALPDAFREAARAYKDVDGNIHKMSCISCAVGELGTFLRPTDKDMVDWLTDLWDGQKVITRRRTRMDKEQSFENPWINVLAATTPSWLRDNFPETMVGGGLTSRIVFVYGDKKRYLSAYPARVAAKNPGGMKRVAAIEKELRADLAKIGELFGPITMTEDAYTWGEAWYEKLWTERPEQLSGDKFQGYFARKQTHVHKVAIVLSVAERRDLIIDSSILQQAETIVTATELDMQKVFHNIGVSAGAAHTKEVASILKAFKKMSKTKLWQVCMQTMSVKDFEESIAALTQAEAIKTKSDGSKIWIYWAEAA